MEEQIKSEIKAFASDVRNWYERTPWAQRARQRLTEDLDTVVAHLDGATSDLQEKVRPYIDPPRGEAGSAPGDGGQAAEPTSEATSSGRPSGTSGQPSGTSRLDASES